MNLISNATAQALTPVSAVSEINPWILGLSILCAVLVALVILARMGKLGGAAAKAVSQTNVSALEVKISADATQAHEVMDGLIAKVDTFRAKLHAADAAFKATAQVPPLRNPGPTAAGFVIPVNLVPPSQNITAPGFVQPAVGK